MKHLNVLLICAVLLLANSNNLYSQVFVETCCPPKFNWNFDNMVPLCPTDFNLPCNNIELSSSLCTPGCGPNAGTPVCCNYFSTHGTPNIRTVDSRTFLELWGDRNSGGEGMMFCVDAYEPQCYNLTFAIRPGQFLFDFVGNLSVNVVKHNVLGESISAGPCYQPAPQILNPNEILEIANIDLANIDGPPNVWQIVTIQFSTNDHLLSTTAGDVQGFDLWFYSNIRNADQRAIRIDDITLTPIHNLVCVQNLFITEQDVPLLGEYKAISSVQISGNPLLRIDESAFIAGDFILVTPNTLIAPPWINSTTTLDINSLQCQPCVPSVTIAIPPNPPQFAGDEDTDFEYATSNKYECVSNESDLEGSVLIMVADAIHGTISKYNGNRSFGLEEQVQLIIRNLPNNRLYFITILCDAHIIQYKKILKGSLN